MGVSGDGRGATLESAGSCSEAKGSDPAGPSRETNWLPGGSGPRRRP